MNNATYTVRSMSNKNDAELVVVLKTSDKSEARAEFVRLMAASKALQSRGDNIYLYKGEGHALRVYYSQSL